MKLVFGNLLRQIQALPLQARVVAITCFCFAFLLVLGGLVNWLSWHASSNSRLGTAEPRIARLKGYIEAEEKLRGALAETAKVVEEMTYEDTGDSGKGGALLQQTLRQQAAKTGLTVIGSELKAAEDLDVVTRLSIEMTLSGSSKALNSFLKTIHGSKPPLFIDILEVYEGRSVSRSSRRGTVSDTLGAKVKVSAYQRVGS